MMEVAKVILWTPGDDSEWQEYISQGYTKVISKQHLQSNVWALTLEKPRDDAENPGQTL